MQESFYLSVQSNYSYICKAEMYFIHVIQQFNYLANNTRWDHGVSYMFY